MHRTISARFALRTLAAALGALVLGACSSGNQVTCVTGDRVQCMCGDGTYGYQTCTASTPDATFGNYATHCDCVIGLSPDGGEAGQQH